MATQKTDNIPNADSETMAAFAAIVKSEIKAALATELDERVIAKVKAAIATELDERAIATEREEKVTIAEFRKRVVILMLFGGIAGYALAKAYLALA